MHQRTPPEGPHFDQIKFCYVCGSLRADRNGGRGGESEIHVALNSTVASVPAREHVFVLTDAKTRTGKRGQGGGEIDSKALSAYDRDVLNENGKQLLLLFAEDNRLALLNTFLHP